MSIKKKVVANLKFGAIKAGGATPAPPVGPALGQKGINIAEFCKEFNAKTADFDKSYMMRAFVPVYEDRTYDCVVSIPETTWFIKRVLALGKGHSTPGNHAGFATIKHSDILEIAKLKMNSMGVRKLDSAVQMVIGTAKSMGIDVVKE